MGMSARFRENGKIDSPRKLNPLENFPLYCVPQTLSFLYSRVAKSHNAHTFY